MAYLSGTLGSSARYVSRVSALALALASVPASAASPPAPLSQNSPALAAAAPDGLPPIGLWLIGADGEPAHWLGALYHGKGLREPINVVLIDEISATPEAATAHLIASAKQAGYPIREGHSTGYRASIGGILYSQLPTGRDFAFSNGPFEFDNNHGRMFGPNRVGNAFVFTGAFSRERVAPVSKLKHQYESFDIARDNFTQSLDGAGAFKLWGFVSLGNAIVDNSRTSTGDHDGMAVVLKATRL